jgi:predicted MFS family arabinose efflux permease
MDEKSLRYEGWRVALAGGVGVFLASLFVYTFGIFLKALSEEFAWSREDVSSAYGAAAIMSASAAILLGYLLDRFRPTLVVVPCLTVVACALAALSRLTPNLWHLYVVFAVLGVAGTGSSAMAYSRAVSSWFDERRGTALSLVVVGGALGAVVHPPLAEAAARWLGWRGASFAFGLLVLAVGVPVVGRFVRERTEASHAAVFQDSGVTTVDGLTCTVFWIQMTVLFVSAIAQNAAIVHLAPLLSDRGVSADRAAMAMSAMGAGSLAGRLITGWLLDRYFGPYVSVALLVTSALGTFLLSDAQSFAIGATAAACIGFGMGGESDVTPYLFSRYFGLRAFSTLYGFTWTATGIAAAIGPILMGRAFDATGSYQSLLPALALATIAAACLLFAMPAYDAVRLRREPAGVG